MNIFFPHIRGISEIQILIYQPYFIVMLHGKDSPLIVGQMQPMQDCQNPPLQRNHPVDQTWWMMVKKQDLKSKTSVQWNLVAQVYHSVYFQHWLQLFWQKKTKCSHHIPKPV